MKHFILVLIAVSLTVTFSGCNDYQVTHYIDNKKLTNVQYVRQGSAFVLIKYRDGTEERVSITRYRELAKVRK